MRSRRRGRSAAPQLPSAESFIKNANLVVRNQAEAPVLSPEAQETRAIAKTTSKLAAATLDQIVATAYNQENTTEAFQYIQAAFETTLFSMSADDRNVTFFRSMSEHLTNITNVVVFGQSTEEESEFVSYEDEDAAKEIEGISYDQALLDENLED